ncbi:thiopurine S-methyltransferase [Litorimonas sp.]|uniref:thiopurine S-methyltransferase n=1 Tax=Litorimonas sp. TaxID=1892381 RepID=UPI003A8BF937
MEPEFWNKKWSNREIAFHTANVHPYLAGQLSTLALSEGARIFLPLCGKTLDIHWLLKQDFQVVGVELVETAVQELFEELDLSPHIIKRGSLKLYRANNIDIYVGDIFDLDVAEVSKIDAVYDRAALVALPEKMRKNYADQVMRLSGSAPQLLITFEYNQAEMEGPPFSIKRQALNRLYGATYEIERLTGRKYEGFEKMCSAVSEVVWCLT